MSMWLVIPAALVIGFAIGVIFLIWASRFAGPKF